MQRPILLTVVITAVVGILAAAVIFWPPDKQLADDRKVAELSETARRKAFFFSQDFVELVPLMGVDQALSKEDILKLINKDKERAAGQEARFPDEPLKGNGIVPGIGEGPEEKAATIQKIRDTLKSQYDQSLASLQEASQLCDQALKIEPKDPLANETKALVDFAQALGRHFSAWRLRVKIVENLFEDQFKESKDLPVAAQQAGAIIAEAHRLITLDKSIPVGAIESITKDVQAAKAKADEYDKQVQSLTKTIEDKKTQLKQLGEEREVILQKQETLQKSLLGKPPAEARAIVDQIAALKKSIIEKDIQADRLRTGTRVTADGKLAPIQQVLDPKTQEMMPKVAGEANEHGLETLESFDLPLAKQTLEGWKKTVSLLETQLKSLNDQKDVIEKEKTATLEIIDKKVAQFFKTYDAMNKLAAQATKIEEEAVTTLLPQVSKNLVTAFDEAKVRQSQAKAEEDGHKAPDKRFPLLRYKANDQLSLLNLKTFKGDAAFLSGLILFSRLQTIREQRDLIKIIADGKKNLDSISLNESAKKRLDELVGKNDEELKKEGEKTQKAAMAQLAAAAEAYKEARDIQKIDAPSDDVFNTTRKNTLWATSVRLGEIYWLMSKLESNPADAEIFRKNAQAELGGNEAVTTEMEGNALVQPSLDLLKLLGGRLQGPAPALPTLAPAAPGQEPASAPASAPAV